MGVKKIMLPFIPLCFFFVTPFAKTSMVEFESKWIPNYGLGLNCTWKLYTDDSLQSVKLYKNDHQFMDFRAETDGSQRNTLSGITDKGFHVDCFDTQTNGVTGQCIMSIEILQPITEDLIYACEVSGERPTFRVESKTINIFETFVPPTDAVVEKTNQNQQSSGQVTMNCSSSGLPAPNLVWRIGDQKIPQDFSGGAWNFTSKLFHVWSTLSYTPVDSNSHAICTPEIVKGGQLVKGHPAQYNAAGVVRVTPHAKISMVELQNEWRPNFGWEVICSWKLYANDSLQSVRLYKTDQQFMVYRPERDGSKRSSLSRLTNVEFHVDCYETQTNGVTGKCVMSIEILQPITEDLLYACEVSGERPTFKVESKAVNIEALVPPSDAVVEKINQNQSSSGRVNVNCTSSGLPAPNLVWTIGDQKIPQDFSGGAWNFTSKLFHVWSTLSYTPVDNNSHAICTPEIVKGGQLVKGHPAQYNGAGIVKGVTAVIPCVLLIVTLTR